MHGCSCTVRPVHMGWGVAPAAAVCTEVHDYGRRAGGGRAWHPPLLCKGGGGGGTDAYPPPLPMAQTMVLLLLFPSGSRTSIWVGSVDHSSQSSEALDITDEGPSAVRERSVSCCSTCPGTTHVLSTATARVHVQLSLRIGSHCHDHEMAQAMRLLFRRRVH